LNVNGALRGSTNITVGTDILGASAALSGTGPTNWTYSILATTNVTQPMSNWGQVDSGPFTDGVFTFTDLNATNHVQRYYRMVTQIQQNGVRRCSRRPRARPPCKTGRETRNFPGAA